MYVRIALSPWLRKALNLWHRMRCQQARLCEVSTDPSGRQIGAHFANCSVREIGAHFDNCSANETGADSVKCSVTKWVHSLLIVQ